MKRFWLSMVLVLGALGTALVTSDADARRLGGGGSAGIRRALPPRQAPATPPAEQQAAPQQPTAPNASPQPAPANPALAPAGATAAAQQVAPRRSWLGPVAGLAAGLGLAALASHLGFGEGLANLMTLLLVALLAIVAIRFLLSRLRGGARADLGYARAGMPVEPNWSERRPSIASGGTPTVPLGPALPAGFDAAAFEKTAKLIFIRMQAANDAGDLNDLRAFTTPEMFAAARLDLQNRLPGGQRTDVVQLAAEVVDFAHEPEHDVVSVRYRGLLREEAGGAAEPFDEVWHLLRPAEGGVWRIAGIQQSLAA